jgi:branched-chain amino acid transport system substrate-binding protein
MKRHSGQALPFTIRQSLEKLGHDIRVARLKRGLTARQLADSLGIHRTTYGRIESGDGAVALALYATALFTLGFRAPFDSIADPRRDDEGLRLDLARLPKRVRAKRAALPRRTPRFDSRSCGEDVVRIGVLGVMSGPAGFWGRVNRTCAEVTAAMYNEAGGIDIGGERYPIEIVCADDRLDPGAAAEGARRLIEQEGIRYVIGPNVSQTFVAAMSVAEKHRAMLFPYSFNRDLYQPPRENSVLGQIAGYQAAPLIYRYLMDRENIETFSIVAPGTPEGLQQRKDLGAIARSLGLRILSDRSIYRVGADNLEVAVWPAIAAKPDVLAIPNAAPDDAARLIKRARELGFRGYITTESAQDVEGLMARLGGAADGLIVVGGACPKEGRSDRMNEFVQRYTRAAGAWSDEAGTKAYALEFVLATLQMAGRAALTDIDRFKSAIDHFSTSDPFVGGRSTLAYYGAKDFLQKRQIGIPLVVNTIREGRLQTLFQQEAAELLG